MKMPQKDILWFVSNCKSPNDRLKLAQELRISLGGRLMIDQFGSCNRLWPKSTPEVNWLLCLLFNKHFIQDLRLGRGRGDWNTVNATFYEQYKFYLSFENSNCRDYITEKLFKVLQLKSVIPLTLGGLSKDDYNKVIPPHSFIHVDDFSNVRKLADYLVYLANNLTAFSEYFWWKEEYRVQMLNEFKEPVENLPEKFNPLCNFCRILHQHGKNVRRKNIRDYWSLDNCKRPYK